MKLVICLIFLMAAHLNAFPRYAIFIRHAEKPEDVKKKDNSQAHEGNLLSRRGYERAFALVPFFVGNEFLSLEEQTMLLKVQTADSVSSLKEGKFGGASWFSQMDLAHNLVAIFATAPSTKHESLRSFLTVFPLHEATKRPLLVMNKDKLIEELKNNSQYKGKAVIVAWAHDEIASIVHALGAEAAPSKWPGGRFDRVWILTFDDVGKVSEFKDVPQRLLYGDSKE